MYKFKKMKIFNKKEKELDTDIYQEIIQIPVLYVYYYIYIYRKLIQMQNRTSL